MLHLSRPLNLLLAALSYMLGASISVYLGTPLNTYIFSMGFVSIFLAQVSLDLLAEVFRPHNEPILQGETPQQKETLRSNLLYVSIAALAINIFFIYQLYLSNNLTLSSFSLYLSSFILVLSYAIPPIRLINRGFGELALALHIAYIIPSIGFTLQFKENQRLLTFILIPLTTLALAYFLILNFATFVADEKYQRVTLLRQLGWQRTVSLHHSLIIFSYLLLALAPVFGFSMLSTALLILPFGILQIILLQRIALGGKPNWHLLTSTALAVFGLTTYFITLTLWIH